MVGVSVALQVATHARDAMMLAKTFAFLVIACRKQLFTVLSHQGNHLDGRTGGI